MAPNVKELAKTARSLLQAGGNLQSIGGDEEIEPSKLNAALAEHLKLLNPSSPLVLDAAAAEILKAANGALGKVADGNAGQVTLLEYAGLEVIVQVTGRPALRFVGGHVQPPTTSLAENEHWQVFVVTARQQIDAVSASVARLNRVEADGSFTHLGTGWRLGENLLVTNRHVAADMVIDDAASPGSWKLDTKRKWIADFAKTDKLSKPLNFTVESLDYCAAEDMVDAAILRLKPAAEKLPPALEPDFGEVNVGDEIYVVGHPLQVDPTAQTQAVFGDADGHKRCSPGRTTAIRDDDPVFDHDCSTLRGNSGSAVMSVGTHRVVGLHFGGLPTDSAGTFGDLNVAVHFARLAQHPLRKILADGHA